MSQRGRYKHPRHFNRGPFYHDSKNTDGNKHGNSTYDNFNGGSSWRPLSRSSNHNGSVPVKKVLDWHQTSRLDSNDSFKHTLSNTDVPRYSSRATSSDTDKRQRIPKDPIMRSSVSRPQLQPQNSQSQNSQSPRTSDPRLRLKQKQIEKQNAQLLEQKSAQKRNDKLELQNAQRLTRFPTQPRQLFNDEKRHNELPMKTNFEHKKLGGPFTRPNSYPSKSADKTQLQKNPKLSSEAKKTNGLASKPLNSNLFINQKETKRKLQHFREEMRKRQSREEHVRSKHTVINDVDESSLEEDEGIKALFSPVPRSSGSLTRAAALNTFDDADLGKSTEKVPEKFDLPDYVQTIKMPPKKVIDISESESNSDPDAPEYTSDTPKNRKKRDPTSDLLRNSTYPSRLQQLTEQRDQMKVDNLQDTLTISTRPQPRNISKRLLSKTPQSIRRSSISKSLKINAKKNNKAEIDEEQRKNGKADNLGNFNGYDGDDEEKDDDFSSDEDDVIDISNQADGSLFKELNLVTGASSTKEKKINETEKSVGSEEKLFVEDSDADLSVPPVPKEVNLNFNTSLLKKKKSSQKSGESQDLLKSNNENIEQKTGKQQDYEAVDGEDGNVVIKPPIREHLYKRLGSIIESTDDEQSVPELITEQKSPSVKKRRRLVRKSREPKERAISAHDKDSESDSGSDIELIGEVKVNMLSPVKKMKNIAIRRKGMAAKRKSSARARRN